MNIAITLASAALVAMTPPIGNPVAQISASAGGITLVLDDTGLAARPDAAAHFEIKLELRSGTPVRIRL